MTVSEICNKKDPMIVSMALSLLVREGSKSFTPDKVKAEIKRIHADDAPNALVAPHISEEVLLLAEELSKQNVMDILRYVQTDFRIDSVKTHPGLLLEIRERAINTLLFRCFLPADTTEDTLEELSERLKIAREGRNKKLGVVYSDDLLRAIGKVLKQMKLSYESDEPDKVIRM